MNCPSNNYPPSPHLYDNKDHLLGIASKIGLGALISNGSDFPFCTHVPFIKVSRGGKTFLEAHVDKYNPQAYDLEGKSVVILFSGPNCYISPNVYTTNQLPTWNYINILVEGKCSLINEYHEKKSHLLDLIDKRESQNGSSFSMGRDDPRFNLLVPEVVGVSVSINRVIGRFKLSQDKGHREFNEAAKALIEISRKSSDAIINEVYSIYDN
jgi:transcriptional regulator